jgi:hypothetical protein
MRIEEDNPGCGPPPPGRDERARPETTTLSRRTPAGSRPNGTSTQSAPLTAAGFPKHPARRPEVAELPHQYTGAEVLGRPVRSAVDSRSVPSGDPVSPWLAKSTSGVDLLETAVRARAATLLSPSRFYLRRPNG